AEPERDGPEQNAPEASPRDDDSRDDATSRDHDNATPEPEEEPAEDARDALSEVVHGEPAVSAEIKRAQAKAQLLLPDRVAVVELDDFFPSAKDPRFLADLYRAVLYLHANGFIQPASGEEGEAT